MLNNTGLNEPKPPIFQKAYPDNRYEVDARTITPVGRPPIYYVLKGLPNDDKLLCKALYEAELQKQYPEEILDGTALKDFVVVK